jgi:LacI family transcriptional regulator
MRVTLRDVAKAAGTSVASVSATLHGSRGETIRVGEATRVRIRAIAEQLGYVADPIAKSLATGKTRSLGLILPYAEAFLDQNPFCNEVMHGVMKEAVYRRYNLTLYTAVSELQEAASVGLLDRRVDGLLLVMPPDPCYTIERCDRLGIPYVSVLRRPVEGAWCVNSDDYEGGRIAARHLLSLGHRLVAHLGGNPEVPTTEPRARGFREALEEAGVEPRADLFVTAGFNTNRGYEVMRRILSKPQHEPPTAVFAANDLCAEGAIRAIREFGLRVPEDVAVVGYDDTWFATMTQPPLTSVRMPISEMGQLATALLIDRLEGREPPDRQPVLPVSLTIRSSCGATTAYSPFGANAVSPAPLNEELTTK